LDVLNRSHRRGLILSIDEIREIRELRNDIVHEYVPTDLKELFEDTLKFSNSIFEIIKRIKNYAQTLREQTQD
jgi:uncharacterized protein YutE (UPF0331/DUF86 family)